MTSVLTKRPISHDEAVEAHRRLVNSHFHNPDHARISIPARPDYDDDLVLQAFIEQQRAENGSLRAALQAVIDFHHANWPQPTPLEPPARAVYDQCVAALAQTSPQSKGEA